MPNFPAFPLLGRGVHGMVAPGTGRDVKPRVLTADFGGGYSQRTGDGINQIVKDVNYKSAPLRETNMKIVTDFLETRKGYLPFTYRPPGELTARQFICSQWNVNYINATHQVLTAVFQENFDA